MKGKSISRLMGLVAAFALGLRIWAWAFEEAPRDHHGHLGIFTSMGDGFRYDDPYDLPESSIQR